MNFNDFFVNVKYILFLGVTFVITSNSHSQCLEGDCENGVGTKKYENGSVYEGEFVSGLKKYGKNTYPSGTIYEGSFLNNQRHGTGKFTYSNGDVFQFLLRRI
jgi:hypothetical protein